MNRLATRNQTGAVSPSTTVPTKRSRRRVGMLVFAMMAMLLSTVAIQTSTTETAEAQGYCDAGWTYQSGQCYQCPSGYTLSGTSCSKRGCPTQYYTNWGGWGSRACKRYVWTSYWSGYVYAPQTTKYATPYTKARRSLGGAVWNVITDAASQTWNDDRQVLIDSYNNTTYAQNKCGYFPASLVLGIVGNMMTYGCMVNGTFFSTTP